MTNLPELCKEWTDILGLQDWTIKLSPEDSEIDSAGLTEWQESLKTAHIHILPEECYGERVVPFDREKTLVHELLHLKFSLLQEDLNSEQDSNTHDRVLHQIINDLAKSFVKVKRQKRSTK